MQYRERSTGNIMSQGEIKNLHKNAVSFSTEVDTYADLGYDKITPVPQPAPSSSIREMVEAAPIDIDGVLSAAWSERDMFSDTVEDGVTTTKAEHETVHIAKLAAEVKQGVINTATAEFEEETKAMTAGYSQAEIDTFPTQEAEARAYTADNATETPLLDAILSESGGTKFVLATTINGKAAALKVGVGKAIGKKQKKTKDAQ